MYGFLGFSAKGKARAASWRTAAKVRANWSWMLHVAGAKRRQLILLANSLQATGSLKAVLSHTGTLRTGKSVHSAVTHSTARTAGKWSQVVIMVSRSAATWAEHFL